MRSISSKLSTKEASTYTKQRDSIKMMKEQNLGSADVFISLCHFFYHDAQGLQEQFLANYVIVANMLHGLYIMVYMIRKA
jgi:hypothetical protein